MFTGRPKVSSASSVAVAFVAGYTLTVLPKLEAAIEKYGA